MIDYSRHEKQTVSRFSLKMLLQYTYWYIEFGHQCLSFNLAVIDCRGMEGVALNSLR